MSDNHCGCGHDHDHDIEEQELENGDVRKVMHFHPALAPVKVAVLPLTKKQSDEAMELYNDLVKDF